MYENDKVKLDELLARRSLSAIAGPPAQPDAELGNTAGQTESLIGGTSKNMEYCLKMMQSVYQQIDTDGDQVLSHVELTCWLSKGGWLDDVEQCDKILKSLDLDCSGYVPLHVPLVRIAISHTPPS